MWTKTDLPRASFLYQKVFKTEIIFKTRSRKRTILLSEAATKKCLVIALAVQRASQKLCFHNERELNQVNESVATEPCHHYHNQQQLTGVIKRLHCLLSFIAFYTQRERDWYFCKLTMLLLIGEMGLGIRHRLLVNRTFFLKGLYPKWAIFSKKKKSFFYKQVVGYLTEMVKVFLGEKTVFSARKQVN